MIMSAEASNPVKQRNIALKVLGNKLYIKGEKQ